MKAKRLYSEILFSVIVRQSNQIKVREIIEFYGKIKKEKTYTSSHYRDASFKFFATVEKAWLISEEIDKLEKEAQDNGDNFSN